MVKDRVAIVTRSDRGIGRAIALLLARKSAKVVVSDDVLQPAQEGAEEIKSGGKKGIVFAGDSTEFDFANGTVKHGVETWRTTF